MARGHRAYNGAIWRQRSPSHRLHHRPLNSLALLLPLLAPNLIASSSPKADDHPRASDAWASESVEEFARTLLELLKTRHGVEGFRFDAVEGAILSEERGVSIHLANVHAEYTSRSGAEQQAYLDQVVAGLASTILAEEDLILEDVRERLFPHVWLTSTLANSDMANSGLGAPISERFATLPKWQLGQHLTAVLTVDEENTSRAVTMDDIDRWGVSLVTLCGEAEARLAKREMPWASLASSEHATSQILMPSEEGGLDYLVGRLVALPGSVPVDLPEGSMALAAARSALTLLVPGDQDLEMALLKTCLEGEGLPYPLQPLPLIREQGAWVNWSPPAGHPLARELREAERQFLGELYGQQKSAIIELQNRFTESDEEDADDLPPVERIPLEFISTFQLMQHEEGAELMSAAIWPSDAETLLPKVDVIVFSGGEDDDLIFAPWSIVERVMGDSLGPMPHTYPVRYRPREFPNEAQRKEIARLSE